MPNSMLLENVALYVTHLLALISDLYKENITVLLSGTNLMLNMKTMSSHRWHMEFTNKDKCCKKNNNFSIKAEKNVFYVSL